MGWLGYNCLGLLGGQGKIGLALGGRGILLERLVDL